MVKQKSTLKAALAVLLALLTITTAVLLAACDTGTLDEDSMPTIHVESEDESSGDESSASQTQPGYADTPEIRDIVNITPDTIFVTVSARRGRQSPSPAGRRMLSSNRSTATLWLRLG